MNTRPISNIKNVIYQYLPDNLNYRREIFIIVMKFYQIGHRGNSVIRKKADL